jgi:hypothetical protein
MRPPKVGQEWVYQVRNVFNQEIVDTVTERVVSVGNQVRIARSSTKSGELPDEIQSPWGYVLQDPHWKPPQKFDQALPVWPEQLNARWSGFYRTRYQVLGYPDATYYWGLNVNASEWGRVTVPAGSFVTLKYQNTAPFFQSYDIFRTANYREEDVDGWHVLVECLLGRLFGVGAYLLEVSKTLKIERFLCIPLKNFSQPFKAKALMLDALQYFVVLQVAISGVVVKKIALQLSVNFAIPIL